MIYFFKYKDMPGELPPQPTQKNAVEGAIDKPPKVKSAAELETEVRIESTRAQNAADKGEIREMKVALTKLRETKLKTPLVLKAGEIEKKGYQVAMDKALKTYNGSNDTEKCLDQIIDLDTDAKKAGVVLTISGENKGTIREGGIKLIQDILEKAKASMSDPSSVTQYLAKATYYETQLSKLTGQPLVSDLQKQTEAIHNESKGYWDRAMDGLDDVARATGH